MRPYDYTVSAATRRGLRQCHFDLIRTEQIAIEHKDQAGQIGRYFKAYLAADFFADRNFAVGGFTLGGHGRA